MSRSALPHSNLDLFHYIIISILFHCIDFLFVFQTFSFILGFVLPNSSLALRMLQVWRICSTLLQMCHLIPVCPHIILWISGDNKLCPKASMKKANQITQTETAPIPFYALNNEITPVYVFIRSFSTHFKPFKHVCYVDHNTTLISKFLCYRWCWYKISTLHSRSSTAPRRYRPSSTLFTCFAAITISIIYI